MTRIQKLVSLSALAAMVLGMLLVAAIFMSQPTEANENEMDARLALLFHQLEKEVQANSAKGLSSNPYDYIKESTAWEQIVGLEEEALPSLERRLQDSSNGLVGYWTALAMERIAGVDLKKQGSTGWETAEEFKTVWEGYRQKEDRGS
ncbi:hypothetical protein N6H14_08565 [Paenibacillus sp. CC-CFT747]|nr:hypothetical protein N6H14_08565 [Paenibacillus sp. CC-CFT747]